MDLASLAFSIDSSDTLKAVQALDALRQTTQATTQSNQDFQTQGDYLVTSMNNQGAAGARLSRQLGDLGDKFQDLMTQAEAARRAFDGSTASFDAWDIAQNKVEALGRAYGTTARGLDSYLQTANQLQMSSTQAAASVQRLTSALENQGAAAANIRQILSNNGVSINDLQTDQIDTLLTRIKSAFQNQPDTQQRTNDLRSVLGTFDPEVLGTFTNPNYVPVLQREATARQSALATTAGRQGEAVKATIEQHNQTDAQLDDVDSRLLLRPSIWQAGVRSPATSDELELFKRNMPEGSDKSGPNTRAGRLALGQYIDTIDLHPNPAFENNEGPYLPDDPNAVPNINSDGVAIPAPRRMAPLTGDALEKQKLADAARRLGRVGPNALTRESEYLQSGQYSEHRAAIQDKYNTDYNALPDHNWYDIPGRLGSIGPIVGLQTQALGRAVGNIFGNFDNSLIKERPQPTALDQEGTGATLSGFGDDRVQRFQAARNLTRTLGVQGTETSGDTKDLASAREKAARAAFTGAYGAVDGDQNFRAARASAVDAQQRAWNDDGAVQSADVAVGLSTMSLPDSAKAKSFIDYAQQHGHVPLSAMAGQSLDQLMDPKTSAGGNLPAGLLDNFNKQYALNGQALSNEEDRSQAQTMGNLTAQAGIAGSGSANLQDLIKYTDAYNASMMKVKDTTLATKAGNDAIAQSEAERSVQLQKTIGDLEAANTAAEKYNAAMDPDGPNSITAGSGLTGANRMAVGIKADIQNQIDALKRSNPNASDPDIAKFTAAKKTEQGDAGVKSAQDKVALAEQELQNQNKLLSVANQRQGVQDKMNRDIEVEVSFQKELAQAQVSGDPGQLDKIEAAIAQMKRLKDAVAAVNLEAKAFKIGQDATNQIEDLRAKMAVRPDQRGAFDAQQPVRDLARTSQNATTADGASFMNFGGSAANYATKAGQVTQQLSTDFGLTTDQASGITGNLGHESGLQGINEINPLKPGSRGGFGWAQWTGPRRTAYEDWAKTNNLDPSTDEANYGYLKYTLGNTPEGKNALAAVRATDNTTDATAAFFNKYESGGDPRAIPAMDDRVAKANIAARSVPGSTGMPNQAQQDTALAGAADKRQQLYDAQGRAGIQEIGEDQARKNKAYDVQAPYLAKGDQVGATAAQNAIPNETDPLGPEHAKADAQAKLNDQEREYQRQLLATAAATKQTTDSNNAMAAAYGDSTDAVQKLQDKLTVQHEALTVRMSDQQKLEMLTALTNKRISEQTAATEQQAKSIKDSNSDQTALNDLGPFASQRDIERKQTQLDIDNYNQRNPAASQQSKDDYATQKNDQQALKERTEQVNDYRQAWSSAESATFSALNSVITGGGRAQDVLKGLASSLANIGLNTLEKGASSYLGGLLGPLFGGGGAAAGATTAGASAFDAPWAVASAQGNAWVDGKRVRAFATGGLIDRPTNFYSAGGETNLAGEMGTEAIMPLKRMPNGDLGVSTGGSKGGSGVTVNAPITVNGASGSSGNGSGMDPKALAQLQAQLQEGVRQAVVAGIADEKRAGGSLY